MDDMSFRRMWIYLAVCLVSMTLFYQAGAFKVACVMALVAGMYVEGLAEKWKRSQVSAGDTNGPG